MRVAYRDGDLLLIVQDDCVVLGELSPERGAAAWVSMQRSPCHPIDLLAAMSGGPGPVGSLTIACLSGEDLVVVSRGDLSAIVRLTDSTERVVSGRAAATWCELVVPASEVLAVELGDERDLAREPTDVRLSGGVVRAAAAELVFAQAPTAPLEPETALAAEPGPALAAEPDPAAEHEGIAAPDPRTALASAPAPARRADPTIVEPSPLTPSPEGDAGLSVLGWEPDDAEASATPEDSDETLSEPDDSYDALWGATVSRVPEDAAVRTDPERHDDRSGPPGFGLVTSVPGSGNGPPPDRLPPESASAQPPGDHDGLTVARSALRDLAPASTPAEHVRVEWQLLLSTGGVVPVDRPVVLGRAPRSLNTPSAQLPRLISVESPHGYVSSTHLEIRVDDGAALVKDVSTNGTLLSRPGLETERLPHGTDVPVTDGCRLDLGDSFSVTVQRLDP